MAERIEHLEVIPDHGRVLLAHPDREDAARRKADELGIPCYVLTRYMADRDRVYVLDVDRFGSLAPAPLEIGADDL